MKYTAIVLSAGKGTRMQSDLPKQYMLLHGKPVIYHSLKLFDESMVDRIVLVCAPGDEAYVRELLAPYSFTKELQIVPGGKERYHSVFEGLKAAGDADYVLIHDGARPLLPQEMLPKIAEALTRDAAVITAVRSKDTVKLADENGYVLSTPNRKTVWNMQTPQCFSYELIYEAYTKLMESEAELLHQGVQITDDAMVLEQFSDTPIRLLEGSYENIKMTTPEDLSLAEAILARRS